MKRIQVYLPLQLIDRLQAHAKRTGIKWTEHIRMAILEYLDKNNA